MLAGAVQFLFKLPDGRKYIHCGDMRFGEHLMGNEHLQRFVGADGVFLDTTYCKAKHQFPPQVLKHLIRNLLPLPKLIFKGFDVCSAWA